MRRQSNRRSPRCRALTSARRRDLFESLEPRVLLSAQPLTAADAALAEALLPNEAQSSHIAFSDLWHLQNTGQSIQGQTGTPGADIDAPDAWDLTTGSPNVVVAVLDSGIDLTHEDLAANIWTKPAGLYDGFANDTHGWNFVDNNNNVQDTDLEGHGTLVSGVIGAVANNAKGVAGVDWNVSILPVKILDTSGSASSKAIISGINYVIGLKQAGVDVVAINASFASSTADPTAGLSSGVLDAIRRAGDNGILFVNAAGNGVKDVGQNINALALLPGWSSLTNVITVAATDNQDHLADFSNYGSQVVALGAPGVNVTTTYPGNLYYYASGTSLATPVVAGAIGLLAAFSPTATAAQIKTAILTSVDPDASLAGKTITGGRLNVYKALETLVGDVAPVGSFDAATNNYLAGWAFDANSGISPISVTITTNLGTLATVAANQNRPDLQSYLGSTAHGWTYSLADLPDGTYTFQAWGLDANPAFLGASPVNALLGTRTITVRHTPTGSLDIANANQLAGWVLDPDTPATPAYYRLDIDGVAGTPALATLNRPDLAFLGGTNHGFSIATPDLAAGFHHVDLWTFDTATGNPTFLISKTVLINTQPIGSLDVLNTSTIAGWAFDQDSGTAPVNVVIRIDGQVLAAPTADLTRNDLVAPFGSANHGFALPLPQLIAGAHTITLAAMDGQTGTQVTLATRTLTVTDSAANHHPIGSLDLATGAAVYGWIYDPDVGNNPITGELVVDGGAPITFTANVIRSDLTPYFGSPNHGYAVNVALGTGRHLLQLYALDPQLGNAPTLIRTAVVGTGPAGNLDLYQNGTLYGWAGIRQSSAVLQVQLDVDGIEGPLYAADQYRADLISYLGSANHAFIISAPPLAAGTHTFTFRALDPATYTFITVATTTVTYP